MKEKKIGEYPQKMLAKWFKKMGIGERKVRDPLSRGKALAIDPLKRFDKWRQVTIVLANNSWLWRRHASCATRVSRSFCWASASCARPSPIIVRVFLCVHKTCVVQQVQRPRQNEMYVLSRQSSRITSH